MGFGNGMPTTPTFVSFNLVDNNDLSIIEIAIANGGINCYVRKRDKSQYYNSFILSRNRKTVVECNVTFFRSSDTGKFLPRLTFKKLNTDGTNQTTSEHIPVNINLSEGDVACRFWLMINFLNSFKEIVDTGEFHRTFAVVSADYTNLISKLDSSEKVKAITDLIRKKIFSAADVKSIVFESRKKTLKGFLWLIKNTPVHGGIKSREHYKNKYNLGDESESIWHHYLKNNDWILGLCADLRFIRDFVNEAKIGTEDTAGKGSPKVDMIGISNYTTLIELKTSDTKIFKNSRSSNARANTWEFTSDFISGVSQCLGQKCSHDENYTIKQVVDETQKVISKEKVFNKDVNSIFIIGCRYNEFPHNGSVENIIKSNTFELFRRNNRNIEIITYDELFERAYHIVFNDKIADNWYDNADFDIPR